MFIFNWNFALLVSFFTLLLPFLRVKHVFPLSSSGMWKGGKIHPLVAALKGGLFVPFISLKQPSDKPKQVYSFFSFQEFLSNMAS